LTSVHFFPASLPAFVAVCVIDDSHSDSNGGQCHLDLHFLDSQDVEHFFLYLSTIYTSFLFYFFNFKIFLYFVVLGYIVTFTKIFTIYFSQIVPSIIVLYAPTS
jgi:hypothetical protein